MSPVFYGAPATDFRDYLPDMAASRIQRPCHLVSSSLYQEFPSAFLRRDEPAEHTAAIESHCRGPWQSADHRIPESVRRHHRQSKCHLIIISRHESGSNTLAELAYPYGYGWKRHKPSIEIRHENGLPLLIIEESGISYQNPCGMSRSDRTTDSP